MIKGFLLTYQDLNHRKVRKERKVEQQYSLRPLRWYEKKINN